MNTNNDDDDDNDNYNDNDNDNDNDNENNDNEAAYLAPEGLYPSRGLQGPQQEAGQLLHLQEHGVRSQEAGTTPPPPVRGRAGRPAS